LTAAPLQLRHDWSTAEIQVLLELPLMELLWRAQAVHREANPGYRVQLASLLSVKTGGCEEDCAYCPQSMHNSSDVTGRPELEVEPVLARARAARDAGAHRFCMGWAWREIRDGAPFEAMLEMVRGVRALGLEACVTAGMLTGSQAERLAEAGLTAYNHNLDTSPEHYGAIISTRTYQERLDNIASVIDQKIERLSANRSSFMDADFALEASEMARNDLVRSSALAGLAQSNKIAGDALRLLG